MSFSFQCPIVIDSTNKWLDVELTAVEYNYSITEGTYPNLEAVVWEFDNEMFVVGDASLSELGITNFTGTDATFKLLFSSGTNAANSIASVLGFAASDYTGSASYDSPNIGDNCFIGDSPSTIMYDSEDRVKLIKAPTFMGISQKAETLTTADDHHRRHLDITLIPSAEFFEGSGFTNNGTYSQWWKLAAAGTYFSYFKDGVDQGTYALITEQNAGLEDAARLSPGSAYFDPVRLVMAPQTDIPRPT